MSGQYLHGPANPNIIWVLNCIFPALHTVQAGQKQSEGERKADGVYIKKEDWGLEEGEWKVSNR